MELFDIKLLASLIKCFCWWNKKQKKECLRLSFIRLVLLMYHIKSALDQIGNLTD